MLAHDTRLARLLQVAAVVTPVDGRRVVDDLLGDDLLAERGTHSGPSDRRGVGEVACAMVEHADVTVAVGSADEVSLGLLRALARPGSTVAPGTEHLDSALLSTSLHDHAATSAWSGPVVEQSLPPVVEDGVWQLDLSSPHPLHPQRLLDNLAALGGGRHRSRGCFWLPTRPDRLLTWDGSGGQLSVGDSEAWGGRLPRTRIVVTGVGTPPGDLRSAFEACVLAPDEAAHGHWRVGHDGFEPWLGEIRRAA